MPTPIYLRKSGEHSVKLFTLVHVKQAAGSTMEFQTSTYLPVDSQSHYYVTRRSPEQELQLWSLELHRNGLMQEPYSYTGVLGRKCGDVPEGWLGDG